MGEGTSSELLPQPTAICLSQGGNPQERIPAARIPALRRGRSLKAPAVAVAPARGLNLSARAESAARIPATSPKAAAVGVRLSRSHLPQSVGGARPATPESATVLERAGPH